MANVTNSVAIWAFALSVVNLAWNILNQLSQNRRWAALNEGKIGLKEARMEGWREVTQDEAHSIEWGHTAFLVGSLDGKRNYRLLYRLDAVNASTGHSVPGWGAVTTVAEAELQAKRLGLNGNFELRKQFRPAFTFENGGKTEIRSCNIKGWLKFGNGEWVQVHVSNTAIDLDGGKTAGVWFDISLPLNEPIPPIFSFRFDMQYQDINGRQHKKTIRTSWDATADSWYHGTGVSTAAIV